MGDWREREERGRGGGGFEGAYGTGDDLEALLEAEERYDSKVSVSPVD